MVPRLWLTWLLGFPSLDQQPHVVYAPKNTFHPGGYWPHASPAKAALGCLFKELTGNQLSSCTTGPGQSSTRPLHPQLWLISHQRVVISGHGRNRLSADTRTYI